MGSKIGLSYVYSNTRRSWGNRYSRGGRRIEAHRAEYWGPKVRSQKVRRVEIRGSVLGAASPSHQLGGLGEHCKLLQRGLGGAPAEMWHLVATILIIFVRINLPDFVQFIKQINYRQHKATKEIRPVGGKAHPKLKAFGHNPVISKTRQANSNDSNDNNAVFCWICYSNVRPNTAYITGSQPGGKLPNWVTGPFDLGNELFF